MFDEIYKNRFAALEEVQELLKLTRFKLLSFLETLARADDAFVRYSFGDLSVTFLINGGLLGCIESLEESGVHNGEDRDQTMISICIEIEKDKIEKSTTYRYNLEDLRGMYKTKQLKIKSQGED